MKKTILITALSFFFLNAWSQTMTINNNTNCPIWMYMYLNNGKGVACDDNLSAVYYRAPHQTQTLDMFYDPYSSNALIAWNLTPNIGSNFTAVTFFSYSHISGCAYSTGTGTSCVYDGNIVGNGTCFSTTACFEVSSASAADCQTCDAGTTITATWTDLGSGNVQVDFN